MGGEEGGTGNCFQGRLKAELRTQHGASAAFEDLERGMPFVDVPDRRLQIQCLQNPGSTDAKEHFLADAGGLVTTIQL